MLRDGSTAHVRPIRPDDAAALVAAHDRLSFETIYFRFFGPKRHLTERDVAYFANVDYENRFAFVGVLDEAIIAVVRYDREPGSDMAEVALVIDDEHQRRGLGTVLLEHLAGAARENGILVFTASVLPDNHLMARVFRDAGWKVSDRFSDGVIEVSFPIELTDESLEVMGERERWAERARSSGSSTRNRLR